LLSIAHREIAPAAFDLELRPDRPDVFGSQWWLDAFVLVEARGLDALEQAFATIIGDRAQALIVQK
jgi:hypothetical protein